jgi:CelD/BcsL family acetyltransferase involved in cellulose biosynthesis
MTPQQIGAQSNGVELIQGDRLMSLLCNATFQRAWSDLLAVCPWATAWQSLEFCEAWLYTYRDHYDGLLVIQHDNAGRIIGLLPLAVHHLGGSLVHVGAEQAEYQVWIAAEVNGVSFIQLALSALSHEYPKQTLKLKYIPPNAPILWCSLREQWGARVVVHKFERPLLSLDSQDRIEGSLRKKSNKSRVRRLEKIAPLTIKHITTRDELHRVLGTIADFYDLRQGATHSCLPFKSDPNKAEFWQRLLEKQGLVHASVLMLGDEVIAAHIGPINRTSVSLGITAYSPLRAEHSPGKLLLLFLGRLLKEQGFLKFDLTPGDKYKDRFADHSDQVHTLDVYFDSISFSSGYLKASIKSGTMFFLDQRASKLAENIRHLARCSKYTSLTSNLTAACRAICRTRHENIYIACRERVRTIATEPILSVNNVSDLLLFEPQDKSTYSKTVFLNRALRRIEMGDRLYTLSNNGLLLHSSWLSHKLENVNVELGGCVELPDKCCLLYGHYTHPSARRADLAEASVLQRLKDAMSLPEFDFVLACVGKGESELRGVIDARFELLGILKQSMPLGNLHFKAATRSGPSNDLLLNIQARKSA